MKIKSFRGKIPNDGIHTIALHTNNGSTGYRIVKLQLLGSDLTGGTQESTVKIFSVEQTAANGTVDFSDQTLIAVGFYEQNTSNGIFGDQVVVFDNVIVNQDIHITHIEGGSTQPVNFHIELEQIKLDLNENTMATLKNIRNVTASSESI
tara:strand:+ start:37 stop:486 length:450 start_codon:yes stop_codon:yes gene_type:complete